MNGVTPSRIGLFLAVAAGGCGVDLATKSWMFSWLGPPGGPTHWLWFGHVGFQTSLNEGALFGIGQGMAWLFAALSLVAALVIVYVLFVAGWLHDRLLTCALAAILAGVLGNLYDRLGLWWTPEMAGYPQHAVRDFILFQYDAQHVWPNFNLADSFLVCGAAVLMLQAWLAPNSRPIAARS
jgi:signal peptidase II